MLTPYVFCKILFGDLRDRFQDLGKTFGSLISIKLANQTAIILQDDGTAMRELFEKRGAEYSRRPCNSVANLVGRRDHAMYVAEFCRSSRKLVS